MAFAWEDPKLGVQLVCGSVAEYENGSIFDDCIPEIKNPNVQSLFDGLLNHLKNGKDVDNFTNPKAKYQEHLGAALWFRAIDVEDEINEVLKSHELDTVTYDLDAGVNHIMYDVAEKRVILYGFTQNDSDDQLQIKLVDGELKMGQYVR